MAPSLEELLSNNEELYPFEMDGTEFWFRPLVRKEFKMLLQSSNDGFDFEDSVACRCTVSPQDYDFGGCKAGIPAMLCMAILNASGFLGTDFSLQMLEQYRGQMENDLDAQMEAVIMHVFPAYKGEEIDTWSRKQLFERYVQAEWTLKALYGPPPPQEDPRVQGLPPPPGPRGGARR